jgi:addiction module RelE/StbE family toxin
MKVRYTRRALANIERIFRTVARDNPAAAQRVVDRIDDLIGHLADAPRMAEVTDIPGIRRLPTGRFPYLIFYEAAAEEIIIHHIRHGARRPWTGPRR